MSKFKQIFFFIIILSIYGCGGGGDTSTTPTDSTTVFNILPASMYVTGYSETYNLTGTDNFGNTYVGNFSFQTQNQTTFLGANVTPVLNIISITITNIGGVINVSGSEYYEQVAGGIKYVGYDGDTTTVSSVASIIPSTGLIGDLGNIGTYTDNAGNKEVITWRLADAGNGRANYIISNSERNQFGTMIGSSTQTFTINPDGSRFSFKVVATDYASGLTFTLTSN